MKKQRKHRAQGETKKRKRRLLCITSNKRRCGFRVKTWAWV